MPNAITYPVRWRAVPPPRFFGRHGSHLPRCARQGVAPKWLPKWAQNGPQNGPKMDPKGVPNGVPRGSGRGVASPIRFVSPSGPSWGPLGPGLGGSWGGLGGLWGPSWGSWGDPFRSTFSRSVPEGLRERFGPHLGSRIGPKIAPEGLPKWAPTRKGGNADFLHPSQSKWSFSPPAGPPERS